ncbi:AzlD domain-containing protein [Salinisphaera dokdonensis]
MSEGMSTTMVWLTIAMAGLLTFLLRWSFIAMIDSLEMPPAVRRALRFVPAAVLSAIIWPAVIVQDGAIDLWIDNLHLIAALIAAVVAWRTRSIFYTIAVGMLALWGLTALVNIA